MEARQWSRSAWAMALVFAAFPLVGRLVLGTWDFGGATEVSCLLLILGAYFHFLDRRKHAALPDPAALLDRASRLAASGRSDRAVAVLTKAIRQSPKLWQAYQYRGEMYLRMGNDAALALRDFAEAIRLAPHEPHLLILREQANSLLDDGPGQSAPPDPGEE